MARNIVICCDGTSNEIEENLSNVLKLYRVLTRNSQQLVYYDPGIGTLGRTSRWRALRDSVASVTQMATGAGLDDDVSQAYRFICRHYQPGDSLYMFGFSRGAYAVRVVAGLLRVIGLLRAEQENLADAALTAYKQVAERQDLPDWEKFAFSDRFREVAGTIDIAIHFLGVWDTVSSVIVPRPDRLYVPSLRKLPYTARNKRVRIFRHAMAIDERRRMFRLNRWTGLEPFEDPAAPGATVPQDIRQVWFAGCHSDIGGGFAEPESGAAKYPLAWMIREASAAGLQVDAARVAEMVHGVLPNGASSGYAPPSPVAPLHDSMTLGWRLLEPFPRKAWGRIAGGRPHIGKWYLPLAEPRIIDGAPRIHQSVAERWTRDAGYRPPNLPPGFPASAGAPPTFELET